MKRVELERWRRSHRPNPLPAEAAAGIGLLGYSYREIAAHERVSLTTMNKQIARAKRLLRALESHDEPQPAAALGRVPRPGHETRDRQLAA